MNRDKRHSDSCLWRLIKTLPRTQWGGNFTPWSPTKCRWQSILAQVPSSGNIPIMGTRKWLTRTLACYIFRPETDLELYLLVLLCGAYHCILCYHSVLLLVSLSRGRVPDCCSPRVSECRVTRTQAVPAPASGSHRPDSTLGKLWAGRERAGNREIINEHCVSLINRGGCVYQLAMQVRDHKRHIGWQSPGAAQCCRIGATRWQLISS